MRLFLIIVSRDMHELKIYTEIFLKAKRYNVPLFSAPFLRRVSGVEVDFVLNGPHGFYVFR